jgi:hypothetical protein
MNAEIVAALAVHFANEGLPLDDRVKNELHRMERLIERLTEEVAALRKRDQSPTFDGPIGQFAIPESHWNWPKRARCCSSQHPATGK